jgi:hypothetical protein
VRFEVAPPLGRAGYCRMPSHLWSRDPSSGEVFSVRMGAFDTDPGLRPSFRQFVDFAAAWEPVPDDGLERFGGWAWSSAGPGTM